MNRRKAAMQIVEKWLDKVLAVREESIGTDQVREEGIFCADELEMLLERMEIPVFGLENGVERTLISYILNEKRRAEPDFLNSGRARRIDILNSGRDHEVRAKFFLKYLDVMRTPRGRWPASAPVPLLSQMAVNLVGGQPGGQPGSVFTAEGFGTKQRAAVLKEIAAGNIVERARLLSCYKEADEAFERRHFQDGGCKNKGYQDACWGYYVLKSNEIKECGITVVSHTADNSRRVARGFFEYEKEFMSGEGSIKVPVGNDGEVIGEIKKILALVLEEFSGVAEPEGRREEYRKARKDFLNQYMAVELMQKEIAEISRVRVRYEGKRDEALLERRRVKLLMQETRDKKSKLEEAVDYGSQMIRHMEEEADEYRAISKRLEMENSQRAEDIKQLETQVQDLKKQLLRVEREHSVKHLLFTLTKKAGAQKEELERLRSEYKKKHTALESGKNELILAGQTMEEHGRRIVGLEDQILMEKEKIEALKKAARECESGIGGMAQEIANQNLILEAEWKNCLQVLEMASGAEEKEARMTVINDGFWEAFDSPDSNRRAQALESQPWLTEVYNRKREKLFCYALRLHREFVRSSTACEWNLKNLMLLWGHPVFSVRDKENCFSSLLGTMFLVTPVLSLSRKASAGFLHDIRKPGELGLLVLDEAGQMPAHLAPPLMYRFHKTLVMGKRLHSKEEKAMEENVLENAENLNLLGIYMEQEGQHLSLTGF